MKIEYAVSVDDFRAQQAHSTYLGSGVGYKAAEFACVCIAGLGIFYVLQGLGLQVGAFLIGLGAAAGIASHFFENRSVRKTKDNNETTFRVAYQQLHCRDRRVVEFTTSGFSLGCNCGVAVHAWSDLTHFSENSKVFFLRAKVDTLQLPKSAFPSEGDRTAFRSLVTDQININRSFASRSIEFLSTSSERRSARRLHTIRGGGWRLVLRGLVTLLGIAYMLSLCLRSQNPGSASKAPFMASGLVALIFILSVILRVTRAKPRTRQALRIHFGEDGLHLQDKTTIARNPWQQFCGFLENDRVFLLYRNPRLYRVIPKRALAERESEFRNLLLRKLPPFDHRKPVSISGAQISKAA